MQWIIPGTTITAKREDAVHIQEQFRSMFMAGGMVLSQVASVSGLEPYTVQNWVKRGFLSKPVQKRYSLNQLCRILNINMLKASLPMEEICGLLSYINGELDDDSDDLIDEATLYFMFVRLAAKARYIGGDQTWDDALEQVTAEYEEPVPGARERLTKVLRVMLTAWVSAQLRWQAEKMMKEMKKES